MGSIQRARKDLPGAIEWYRRALVAHPDYLESMSNLGAVLVEDDRAEEAVPVLEKALRLMPNYPEALCNMGLARLRLEQVEAAVTLLQRSLQLKPGYAEASIGLARALHELDRLAEAEALLRQVLNKAPQHSEAWTQLGSICMEQDKPEQAEAAYLKALEIEPDMSDALSGLGNLRLEAGRIDEAEALLKQAMEIKPDHIGARFHLTQVKKVKPGDANLAAIEALLPQVDSYTGDKRISLHYALGKAYDDCKEYDRAFPHFWRARGSSAPSLHYDADADAARCQRVSEVFDRDFLRHAARRPATPRMCRCSYWACRAPAPR